MKMNEPSNREGTTKDAFRSYWQAYGGLRAMFTSPYLYGALFLTVAIAPAWWSGDWWTNVLQVLPNIVGFSIGGYAIWLGFGDEKFKALMAYRDGENETTPYMEVSATFCHFVVVQLVAIVIAIVGSSFNFDATSVRAFNSFASVFGLTWGQLVSLLRPAGGFVGVFAFMYALATALAAVLAIFKIAQWFEMDQNKAVEFRSRRVVCAAIRNAAGDLLLGIRHYSADMHRQIEARRDGESFCHRHDEDQGFVDQYGVYMGREEAYRVAASARQIINEDACGFNFDGPKLYSEGLY